MAGKYTGYYTAYASSFAHANYAEDLLSGGTLLGSRHWKNNQQPYIWAGSTFELTALDPVRFYADIIVRLGRLRRPQRSQRHGWFIDAAAEYTGWTWAKPQLFGWWSTGEDGSTSNGSERIAHTRPNWGPGNSFLFDDGQVYGRNGEMGIDPAGTWGLAASLDKISYMPRLSHRVTVAYTRGTNSPTAIRDLNNALAAPTLLHPGPQPDLERIRRGRQLRQHLQPLRNLNILIETGWARGHFQKSAWASTWGNDLVNRANNNDAWKVAFGFTYKF